MGIPSLDPRLPSGLSMPSPFPATRVTTTHCPPGSSVPVSTRDRGNCSPNHLPVPLAQPQDFGEGASPFLKPPSAYRSPKQGLPPVLSSQPMVGLGARLLPCQPASDPGSHLCLAVVGIQPFSNAVLVCFCVGVCLSREGPFLWGAILVGRQL